MCPALPAACEEVLTRHSSVSHLTRIVPSNNMHPNTDVCICPADTLPLVGFVGCGLAFGAYSIAHAFHFNRDGALTLQEDMRGPRQQHMKARIELQ